MRPRLGTAAVMTMLAVPALSFPLTPAETAAGGQLRGTARPPVSVGANARTGEYDVRSFGAAGDGLTDDTRAIQAAINAACMDVQTAPGDWRLFKGHGGTVYFPPGTYRTTAPLLVWSGGVTLAGAGIWSSAVFLETTRGTADDVVSISRARTPAGVSPSSGGGYGGGVRNMFFGMKTPGTGRDGVRVDVWGSIAVENVWIEGAGSAGLWLGNVVLGTFRAVYVKNAGTGLRIGTGSNSDYSTVLSFDNFHVVNTSGPGLDGPQCFGCTFLNSVFEGVGSAGHCADPAACPALAIGRGEWSFYQPYFEGNRSWDMDLAALRYGSESPQVGIFGYTSRSQPRQKINDSERWQAGHSYRIGGRVTFRGSLYEALTQGKSRPGHGPLGTARAIPDGDLVWSYVGPTSGGILVGAHIRGGLLAGGWWLDTHPLIRFQAGAKGFSVSGMNAAVNETNVVADVGLENYRGLIAGLDDVDRPVLYGIPQPSAPSRDTSDLVDGETQLAYPDSIAPSATKPVQRISITSRRPFVIRDPVGGAAPGQQLTVIITNASGGALGAISWGPAYRSAGFDSGDRSGITKPPAAGFQRSIVFTWTGSRWCEVTRSPADVPQ